ncbi:Ribosomal protein L7Ae [Lachnospiraceae bacterium C7]|nr:Ribosomal protein L7Ae [Lachnospiraceae bacterium C7]
MQQNKTFSMLGISAKAGKVASGEFSTEKAVKEGKAYLVIVSNEASDNTKKKFTNMTNFYEVPYKEFGTKDELGHYIGRQFRASLAITDENLAKAILKTLD